MTTKSDAEWTDRLQSPTAPEAAREVMTAGDAVRKASAEARARSEAPDREQDAVVLATHLAPVLMELAAETLLDAETDGGRAAVREWVRETLAGTGEDAVVELHDVLGELIAPTRRRRERREHAVLRIAERMLPGAEAEREAAAGRRVSEHTVVIGGNAAERGAVLAETIAEMEGDPDRIVTVRLDGRSLDGGAGAMWGAAAEQVCGPAGDEAPNPLDRLLEHDENRRIGILHRRGRRDDRALARPGRGLDAAADTAVPGTDRPRGDGREVAANGDHGSRLGSVRQLRDDRPRIEETQRGRGATGNRGDHRCQRRPPCRSGIGRANQDGRGRRNPMEPTLPDGASILVNLEQQEPHDGRIFVMRIGDAMLVKRLVGVGDIEAQGAQRRWTQVHRRAG